MPRDRVELLAPPELAIQAGEQRLGIPLLDRLRGVQDAAPVGVIVSHAMASGELHGPGRSDVALLLCGRGGVERRRISE